MEPTLDSSDQRPEEDLPATITPHDTTKQETELSTEELEDMLVRDFYLSFKFSQGWGYAQDNIFELLMGHYTEVLGYDYNQIINALESDKVTKKITKLTPPKAHAELSTFGIEKALKKEYLKLLDLAKRKPTNIYTSDRMRKFIIDMLDRDIEYQVAFTRPRPDGHQKDKHSSVFRDYILFSKPTSSENFNAIFNSIREDHLYRLPTLTVRRLAHAWEVNHPGEIFLPANLRYAY